MSIFVLKVIALIAMALDHIAEVFGWEGWNIISFNASKVRYIGRLSYPIFAFCIVSGWINTHDRKKYFSRICLCAFMSQIPFSLAFYTPNLSIINSSESDFIFRLTFALLPVALLCILAYWWFVLHRKVAGSLLVFAATCLLPIFRLKVRYMWLLSGELNVLYTLAVGIAFIFAIEKIKEKALLWFEYIGLLIVLVLVALAYGTNADYGIGLMGIALIVALYLAHKNKYYQSIIIMIWGGFYYGLVIGNWRNALATVIPSLLIMLYNQKHGSSGAFAKHFFYAFYPLHLLGIGMFNVFFRLGYF